MTTLTVVGRLGRDAEVKYTDKGTAVAELAVAYNYGRKGDDGNRPTQWVRGSLWGQQAESLAPYLLKGKGVVLTLTDVHVRTYERNGGGAGASLEGRVAHFEFAPSERNDDGGQRQQPAQQQQQRPQQPQQNAYAQQTGGTARAPQQQAANPYQAPMDGLADMDDDIPF